MSPDNLGMKTSSYTLLKLLILVFVVITFNSGLSVQAQSVVSDPLRDFLHQSDETIRQPVETPRSVLQMSIHLAGHGKPCLFLSLHAFYTKGGGYQWSVYLPVKGGYVEALPQRNEPTFMCYQNRIYVGPISEVGVRRGSVTFVISHESGGIDAYWLKGRKMMHKEILAFPFPEEAGNPDGSITSIPMLLKYFPKLAKPYTGGKDLSDDIPFDDLRARGYAIPQPSED